ncbi:hypothetical protein ACFLXC_05085 [Chloroflexota bacterium]
MTDFIAFDLVGPLSPQDNTVEFIRHIPDGVRLVELINRYGSLLEQENRDGYETGDTRVFIMPFLLLHDITVKDIVDAAVTSNLIEGAQKLISSLQSSRWKVFCISTIYEQYAQHIAHRLDIFSHSVACTPFPVEKLRQSLSIDVGELLRRLENEILAMRPGAGDQRLKNTLDTFFLQQLPETSFGKIISAIKPVTGRRKLEELQKFSVKYSQPLSDWVVIADSLTDCPMLKAVDEAGGLAVAYNADRHALSNATLALASTMVSDLMHILPAWQKGRRKGIEQALKDREKAGVQPDNSYFYWLAGRKEIEDVIELHQKFRVSALAESGKTG